MAFIDGLFLRGITENYDLTDMNKTTHLCACGCGKPTRRYKETKASRGMKKGDYARFLPNHHLRTMTGKRNPMWQGGMTVTDGYVVVRAPGHPRARGEGHYVRKHILVMEKRLGRYLTANEIVHHRDGNRMNNRIGNLQLFASHAEHMNEHRKLRAFAACGNRDWLVCRLCGHYDDPNNMRVRQRGQGLSAEHVACRTQRTSEWRKKTGKR